VGRARHTGPYEAITALTDDGIEELSDMLIDARIASQNWHEFLDGFVHDTELVACIKAQSPREQPARYRRIAAMGLAPHGYASRRGRLINRVNNRAVTINGDRKTYFTQKFSMLRVIQGELMRPPVQRLTLARGWM